MHRDISPQNILISFDGSVKLVDFGIAKAADQASMTKSGAIKGKFAYMSPEQAGGKNLDHRSDIFAIGLVLYELLTGVRPLKRDSELATLQAALECEIEPPSQVAEVPSELDDVVMRALAKNPDDRYENARLFQMALEEYLVSQRMVATSVQISELMTTLFADRLAEEAKLGHPEPAESLEFPAAPPAAPSAPPPPSEARTNAAALSWEAPPGEDRPSSRSGARSLSKGSYNRGEATQMESAAVPDVPAWDAPSSVEPARRRTGETRLAPSDERKSNPGTPPRTTTNPGLRRAMSQPQIPAARRNTRPPDDELDDERTTAEEVEPRRPGNSAVRRRGSLEAAPAVDPLDERGMPEPPAGRAPTPARRRTGQVPAASAPRKTASRVDVPARRPIVEDEPSEVSATPSEPIVAKTKPLPVGLIAKVSVAVIALAVIGLFHQQILAVLNSRAADSVSVQVTSNLPVTLSVRHAPGESNLSAREEMLDSSLAAIVTGHAHPGDTLVLENRKIGAYAELPVPAGKKPSEAVRLTYEFKKGEFTPKFIPSRTDGLTLWLGEQQIAEVEPGLSVEFVEGQHFFTVKGSALKVDVPLKVTVKAGKRVDAPLDLTAYLAQ